MFPQRILFLAEGQLGDLLLLTPALRSIMKSLPNTSVNVLVLERRNSDPAKLDPFCELSATPFERQASVLATNKNIDELYALDRTALRRQRGIARVRAEIDVIRFFRRKKFDAVVCTFPEDRFVQWAFTSGSLIRVGQRKQGLHWLLTHKPMIEKKDLGVLKYYCALVETLGAKVQSTHTEYAIPESSLVWAEEFLASKHILPDDVLIAVHPGASGEYKIWPPEKYATLIDHLSSGGMKVLLVGGAIDRHVIQEIKKLALQPIVEVDTGNVVGNLAAILHRCRLCISNDSGPRHLAVAVGVPSLALFRQHHDREWSVYPESSSCRTLKSTDPCPVCPADACRDKVPDGERFGSHCIRRISVEHAFQVIREMIKI